MIVETPTGVRIKPWSDRYEINAGDLVPLVYKACSNRSELLVRKDGTATTIAHDPAIDSCESVETGGLRFLRQHFERRNLTIRVWVES